MRNVLPSARSVIVAAINYNTDRPYSTECSDPRRAQIARYAWGDDYHDVIPARLEALLEWMREQSPEPFEARAYVDTGPVQERVYAQHAGIGWIGKKHESSNPRIGSWIFLARSSAACRCMGCVVARRCGTCSLCLDACRRARDRSGVPRFDPVLCIHDRVAWSSSRAAASGRRLACLRVRHLPGSLSVERCRAAVGRCGLAPRARWDRVDLLTLARRGDD